VGDLEDAIREHLELKRRRGADPSEVAREEHEALAPITRNHRVVVALPPDPDVPDAHEFAAPAGMNVSAAGADDAGVDEDATQEFRVEHDGDWLAGDD